MVRVLLFFLLIVTFIEAGLVSQGWGAEEKKIEAEGQAPLTDSNQALAKGKAIKHFHKVAIKKCLEEYLGGRKVGENEAVLTNAVIANAETYIKSFRVISEGVKDSAYVVSGEAVIDFHLLKEQIKRLNIEPDKKAETNSEESGGERVLEVEKQKVVWSFEYSCDQQIGEKNGGAYFEEVVKRRLSDKGYVLVEPSSSSYEESDLKALKGSFYCFNTKVKSRFEVSDATDSRVMEEEIPLEDNTPFIDGVTVLLDLMTEGLLETLEDSNGVTDKDKEVVKPKEGASDSSKKPGTARESEQPKETGSEKEDAKGPSQDQRKSSSVREYWQMTIKHQDGFSYLEKIARKLKEKNIKLNMSRIQMFSEAVTVELVEVDETMVNNLKDLSLDSGEFVKIEKYDSAAKQLVVTIETSKKE